MQHKFFCCERILSKESSVSFSAALIFILAGATGLRAEELKNSNNTDSSAVQEAKIPKISQGEPENSPSAELPIRLYIGPDFFYRDYSEEEIVPGFKSDEFGTLFGVQAALDYVKPKAVYFGASFRYGGGRTTYDGGLQDNQGNSLGPAEGKTDNRFLNIEGRLGYTFQPSRRLKLSPFVALGYHRWNRDIGGELFSPIFGPITVPDLVEVYTWGYVGPGFQAEYKVSRKFSVGLNAKLMAMFSTDFSVESRVGNLVLDQGSGNLGHKLQYEVEVPLTFHLLARPRSAVDLKLTPYFRSQNIGRGDIFPLSSGGFALEPASTTSVYGVTLGVQFRF